MGTEYRELCRQNIEPMGLELNLKNINYSNIKKHFNFSIIHVG